MTLECRLPVFRNQRCSGLTAHLYKPHGKTAPPNGYRRKEESLRFLTMPDLRAVYVEKAELF